MDVEAMALQKRFAREWITERHGVVARYAPQAGDVLLVARHMLASKELVQVGPELYGRQYWTVIRSDDAMAVVWLQYALLCDAVIVDVVESSEAFRRIRGGKVSVDASGKVRVDRRPGVGGFVGGPGDVAVGNRAASRIRRCTALGGR